MSTASDLGLIDNGDGTFSDPSTPGVLYDANGNATGGAAQTTAPSSNVTTDSSGNVVVTNQDGSTSSYPPGSKQDASGNILNTLGQIIGKAAPGLLASALSPYLSNLQTNGTLQKTANNLLNVGNNIRNIQNPNLSSLIPTLQKQQLQGTDQAATATAAQQAPSNMAGVNTDAQSLAAQRAALAQLANVGTNGGMTDADRAQLQATINQTNAAADQQRQAQVQQLQMQGNAGTGAELAARLAGGQQMADANATAGAGVAESAQARALAAIQANLQGNANLNTQQFGQQAQKAQAQDVVNQFNTAAQNTIAQQNAAQQQQANNANYAMANQVAGTNTGITNQNLLMPLQTAQQQYTNELGKQTAGSTADVGAGKPLADLINPQISRANTTASGATTTAATTPTSGGSSSGGTNWGQVAGAIGSIANLFSDEDLKTDKKELTDKDVDDMMAQMTGYQYRYKGPKTNPTQAGVMAQDMPKGSVIDTPAGKMVQGPQATGMALAMLANQHDRIKRLEGAK